MTRRRVAAAVYVAAPGVLVLASTVTDWDVAYLAALVIALPLSLVANVVAFVVTALLLPGVDSNGAPIAAALLSGAALLQFLTARAVVNRCPRHRSSEG